MECDVSSIVDLYPLPTGRRVHAMTEVERRAVERGVTHVASHARRGVEHDQETLVMEQQRRGESRAIYSTDAHALDPVLDRSVLGFESYLDNQIEVFAEDSERSLAASQAKHALFPTGAKLITQMSYVEQHAEIDTLLRRADEPELAAALAKLPDAPAMLDRIRELNAEYGSSIRAHERTPSAAEVRQARATGHELMAETIVLIIAHFLIHAPGDKEGRNYLLEPILRQMDLARQTRRRRRGPGEPDTDADTDTEPGSEPDDMLTTGAADDAVTGEFPAV